MAPPSSPAAAQLHCPAVSHPCYRRHCRSHDKSKQPLISRLPPSGFISRLLPGLLALRDFRQALPPPAEWGRRPQISSKPGRSREECAASPAWQTCGSPQRRCYESPPERRDRTQDLLCRWDCIFQERELGDGMHACEQTHARN